MKTFIKNLVCLVMMLVTTMAFSQSIVLPVTFHKFTASLDTKMVTLEWTVDTDDDFTHYSVERSTDGKNYAEIGMVMTTGGAREISNYRFKDGNMLSSSGVIYYRLKWIEANRETVVSQVRVIRLGKDGETLRLVAYPNPVKDQLRLTFPSSWQGKQVQVELVSSGGIRMKSLNYAVASQTESIATSSLATGLYLVKAVCDGQVSEQRIIKD